jgi:hypothetical protein
VVRRVNLRDYPPKGEGITKRKFFMKNFIKWFGVIAFVAIIGFSFSSCVEPKDDSENLNGENLNGENLNGTWLNPPIEMKLDDGNFENTWVIPPSGESDGLIMPDNKGTYTTDGGKITFTTTSLYGGGLIASFGIGLSTIFTLEDFEELDKETWYTYDEIKARMDAANNNDAFYPDGEGGKVAALAALDSIFVPTTSDYTLNGDTLTITTITYEDEEETVNTRTYTRK